MNAKNFLKGVFSRIKTDFSKIPVKIVIILALLISVGYGGYLFGQQKPVLTASSVTQNNYVDFLTEVYDLIQESYWEKLSDEQLTNLFILGSERLIGQPQALKIKDKKNLEKMLAKTLKELDTKEKKREFTTTLTDAVLSNLKPVGRSRLYTQKDETALENNVNNINPEVNQYNILGIDKEATPSQIAQAWQKQSQKWNPQNNNSPEAKEKYEQIQQAYKVLGEEDSRQLYDVSGVEPTMDYKLLSPNIFYIHMKKFSPTTPEELLRVTSKVDTEKTLDTLILDLRDNIGGAIDGLPWFLGPFIGYDQYAYQFFHQGETEDYKTRVDFLPSMVRYKKVVILINEQSQSTAEVMAATLKKYNVGVLVGTPTKGWGTIEKVFPLSKTLNDGQKYSAFLVHSVTLREDGQPIEGRGVDPAVNIKDPAWEKQLYAYFNNPELVQAVKDLYLKN